MDQLSSRHWASLRYASIALGIALACTNGPSMGPPVRLVGGTADTVIINHRRQVRIPVRVLDAAGHALPDSNVRFRWVAGENIALTADGMVMCSHSTDASVEASLGSLTTTMLVRCRPVKTIVIAGPIQFMLPDTAQQMRMSVLDLAGNEVTFLNGTSDIGDTTVATIDGIRLIPKSAGTTVAGVRFGNQSAGVGVHVYERASTLDGLRLGKELVGIPLRMAHSEVQSWHLPAGTWMLTMLPESDEASGLRLRIEGANCSPSQLTKRRYVCLVTTGATVIIYHPSNSGYAPELSGQLLVRRVNS